jgi:predicted 2-oxoglutarate/Fe(II)-dependent dioxygenase YbiX
MDAGVPEAAEVLVRGVELRREIRRVATIDIDVATIAAVEAMFDGEREAVSGFFDVDLGEREGAGFLRYQTGDYYQPHRDRADVISWPGAARRTIALVTFLNGGDEFEGGILRIYDGTQAVDVVPAAGLLAAFPADLLHEVTTVLRGTRDTVVDWFYSMM